MKTKDLPSMMQDEWLEADGLGGFASGTVSGIRTRRYHALLLTATKPPAGRIVLVNGFDAAVETASGTCSLSSQLYPPNIVHPDGASHIVEFNSAPWPTWVFALQGGAKIQQQIFVLHGASLVALSWRVLHKTAQAIMTVTPFLSGRDYHSIHHENAGFRFQPEIKWAEIDHLNDGGLGHVAEIADAELPHTPRGCPFQAWSLGELIRLDRIVLG